MRRLFWLVLLGGAGYAGWSWYSRRDGAAATTSPPPTPAATPAAAAFAAVPELAAWVVPGDDGECPLSHPVKANANSGIYHVPGGRFYDRTRAERCYASAEAAVDDGYRQAKS